MARVITICGSMSAFEHMLTAARERTMIGEIVLMPFVTKGDLTQEQQDDLDAFHREKIDMSSAILVVTMDNYIGKSTQGEISYAAERGLDVLWWNMSSPFKPQQLLCQKCADEEKEISDKYADHTFSNGLCTCNFCVNFGERNKLASATKRRKENQTIDKVW